MFLIYKNYQIFSVEHDGVDCFKVKTPENIIWVEIAVNKATAKKWIDAHIQEKKTNVLTPK